MQCPVCKADNAQGPNCRRCKTDLQLLWSLEAHRQRLLATARQYEARGDWLLAQDTARHVERLRSDVDSQLLMAKTCLMIGDYSAALHYWRAVRKRVAEGSAQ